MWAPPKSFTFSPGDLRVAMFCLEGKLLVIGRQRDDDIHLGKVIIGSASETAGWE